MLWPCCCIGQTITIRVVNVETGKALQKQEVSVSLLYQKGEPAPETYDALLHLWTDANGEAQIELPQPAPQHISAQVHLTSEHWRCGCIVLADTQDVIHEGITGPEPTHKSGGAGTVPAAKHGEILISARPLTFLERLLYPLVKG
jgi:hypothetical protein